MAPLKTKVISASSQDSKHLVENLLNPTNLRKWCCSKSEIDKDLIVELGFDVGSKIEHINIGNDGSAFVEITVGRSSWPSNRSFEVLLPTVSLMTPAECKSWVNTSKVVLLGKASFRASIAEQKWDRIRVRCRQPFATGKQFGLVFVELRGSDQEVETGHLTDTHGSTKSDDGCDNFKEIVEKAIYSSRKSFKPSLGMSRTEKCLEKALSKSNTGSRDIRKGWSDSALLKSKTSVLKKFQQEVECFLEDAKIGNKGPAQLPDLVKNMEKSHGTILNRAERRVFCEIVGKKYNSRSSEKNLQTKSDKININGKRSKEQKDNSWTFRNRIKSFSSEPSRPGSGSSRNDNRAVTWPVTPSSSMKNDGSNNHTNRCMQRRSTNVSRSILLYGDDIEGPPNKQPKEEAVTKETSEANAIVESTNTPQTTQACPLCGKSMSAVALEIHAQFCSGKIELDDDSQEDSGPVADKNAGHAGKKGAPISSQLEFAGACVTSTVQSMPSHSLNVNGGREPQNTRPASRKPKARKYSHSGPVATTAARSSNMTSVANTTANRKGRPKDRQKADLSKISRKLPYSLSTVRSAMLTAAVANAVVAANLEATSKTKKQASSHNGRRYPVSSNAPIAVAATSATTATKGNGRSRGRKQVASLHTGPHYPVAALATGAVPMAAPIATAVKAAGLKGRPKGKKQVASSQNYHSFVTVAAARSTAVTAAVSPTITTADLKRNSNDRKQPSPNRQCGFVHHAIRVRPPTVTTTVTATVVPTSPTAVTAATTAPLTIDLTRGILAETMHSTAADTAMQDSNTPLAYQQAIQNIAVAWPHLLGLPSVENAQCPVCLREYPTNIIQAHANQCLDLGP